MRKVQLVISRFVYSSNHESDNHGCGKKQGSDPLCRVDRSDDVAKYPIGSKYVVDAGAPGTGRAVYEIIKVDTEGAWGIELSNTIRELDPSEVI